MHLYIFILILNLFLFIGCGDSSHTNNKKEEDIKLIFEPKYKTLRKTPPKIYNFLLRDINDNNINIETNSNYYEFSTIDKPIVLILFFATWAPPCIGEIPHLNDLEKKYSNKLSILGIMVYDNEIKDSDLKRFIISYKIDFFISKSIKNNRRFANFIVPKLQLKSDFSIPLMILFVKGKYYTHYEGSIPIEMIESDIKQALKKIKD